MALREKLRTLGLAGIAAVAMSSCGDEQYHFNGKIDDEHVAFWEETLGLRHYLKVYKPDGTVITYGDWSINNDVQQVTIRYPDGVVKNYLSNQKWTKPILDEAGKQYTSYLAKILDAKTKEGLKALVDSRP